MDLNVCGKNFFLAASSKGIGFGITKNLAKDGANILLGARNIKELEKAASDLENFSGKIRYSLLNVADENSIRDWIAFGVKKLGEPYGLLVNSGGPKSGYFEDLTENDWLEGFNITLLSAIKLIKFIIPYMIKNREGSVLSITSSSVKEPIDGLLLSNVLRPSVASLMKNLANEYAKYNIRFNNLIPGRIDTDRVKQLDSFNASKKGVSIEKQKEMEHSQIPLGRYGDIDEIGKAGAFLLSEAASYITGAMLTVDGGKIKSIW